MRKPLVMKSHRQLPPCTVCPKEPGSKVDRGSPLGRARVSLHNLQVACHICSSVCRGDRERILRGNDVRRRREDVVHVCEAAEAVEAVGRQPAPPSGHEADCWDPPPPCTSKQSAPGDHPANGRRDEENSIRCVAAEDLRDSRMLSMAIAIASDGSLGAGSP